MWPLIFIGYVAGCTVMALDATSRLTYKVYKDLTRPQPRLSDLRFLKTPLAKEEAEAKAK